MLNLNTVTILGGTGFIGRYLVKELAKSEVKINVVSRYADQALFLKMSGSVGQINLIKADLLRETKKLEQIISVSDVVINLVSSSKIKQKKQFHDYYAKLPELIARFSNKYKIKKFVHISALISAPKAKSSFAKKLGENLVKEEFPETIIIRPSLVFGIEDNFFNRIIKLSKILPFFPLPKNQHNMIQPVYVNDLAKALNKIIFKRNNRGQIYHLAGPDIFSLADLVRVINQHMSKKVKILYLPEIIFTILAGVIERFNTKIITRDHLKRIQENNIIENNQLTFFDMQLQLHGLGEILPSYNGIYQTSCYFENSQKKTLE